MERISKKPGTFASKFAIYKLRRLQKRGVKIHKQVLPWIGWIITSRLAKNIEKEQKRQQVRSCGIDPWT